jgi:hypothetical protein
MACDNSDMRTTPACTPGATVCSDDEAATLVADACGLGVAAGAIGIAHGGCRASMVHAVSSC